MRARSEHCHSEKPEECGNCGWATDQLSEVNAYARNPDHGPFTPDDQTTWAWLCDVCLSTPAGNAYLYPQQYSGDVQVLGATLNWGINAVLAAIKEWNA